MWFLRKRCVQTLSVITHFFLELLDAFFLFDRIGIRTQTRSAVVTHGLENKTDGYLGIFDSFCVVLLQYVASPNGLALAWGRSHDARRPTPRTCIYTETLSRWTHISLQLWFGNFIHREDSDNVSKHGLWFSPSILSKAHRSQKKRGTRTQKGKPCH